MKYISRGGWADATGHHVTAGRLEFGAAGKARADFVDLAILDFHTGLIGQVGGDAGAIFDDFGHVIFLKVGAGSMQQSNWKNDGCPQNKMLEK